MSTRYSIVSLHTFESLGITHPTCIDTLRHHNDRNSGTELYQRACGIEMMEENVPPLLWGAARENQQAV